MPVLDRDHPLSELGEELERCGVGTAVLVQVLNDAKETDDYLRLASTPPVVGVVGWVDLLAPDCAERIDDLLEHPSGSRLLGIRHQALAEPDPAGWLEQAAAGPGLTHLAQRGLVFDLMFSSGHLDVVDQAVARHLDTSFVLDHAGKVPIRAGWGSDVATAWADRLLRLSGHPHLACKLSGLTTMADLERWTPSDLEPFFDHLLRCFGAERLIFGSDWPVSLRAGSYEQTLEAAQRLVAGMSAAERAAVLGDNARRIYRLGSGGRA